MSATIKFLNSVECITAQTAANQIVTDTPDYFATSGYVNNLSESLNPLLSPGRLQALAPTLGDNIDCDPISKSQMLLTETTTAESVFLDSSVPFGTIINTSTPLLGFALVPQVATMSSSTQVFINTSVTRFFHFTTPPAAAHPTSSFTSFTSVLNTNPNTQPIFILDAAYPTHDDTLLSTLICAEQISVMGLARPSHVSTIEFPYDTLRSDTTQLDVFPAELRVGVFSNTTIRKNTTIQTFPIPTNIITPQTVMLQPWTIQHGTLFAMLCCGVYESAAGGQQGFAVISSPTAPSRSPPPAGAKVTFVVAYY